MVKPRDGFHDMFAQIPLILWERLCAEAEEKGESATRVLTRILAKNYRISADELPKPKKAGRKPGGDES